jgi:pyruvate/2-oxoglutarate dehydrogenase complex dihydrolipoamide acyltransferase (E2) component
MADTLEVKVPDIGDFHDIPVIDVLVKPGDRVSKEDSLITLESDKATMDVPSPVAGVVAALKVKVGDKVSKGTAILTLEASDGEPAARASEPSSAPAAKAPPVPAPTPAEPHPPTPAAGKGASTVKADV